jgi:tetratricopeptide (TPR) repeat protein
MSSRKRKRAREAAAPPAPAAGTPAAGPARPTLSRRRKWLFRLTALIAVPALFFVVLEAGLRVCGYGYPTGFFVKVDQGDNYTTNPWFDLRFFPPAMARVPEDCELPANKADDTCRIFILGSSAANGTPDASFSFGRILEVMLRETYPRARFEVVNAAMTAINSHVVRVIARDCARREADLFVVYMGNNEVIGPFGPGTVLQRYAPPLPIIRAILWAKSMRTGQLMDSLLGAAGRARQVTQWHGMEMFLHSIAANDPRLQKVYANFRSNLQDICDAAASCGARTIVCTVAVNLKDCAPFASRHRADLTQSELSAWEESYQRALELQKGGRTDEAIASFEAAARLDDRFAELQFQLGQCQLAGKRFAEARRHFELARDLDTERFRADSRINEVVREVAAERATRGVVLVDADQALAADALAPSGIPGEELFYEHVHFNFEGNYALASAVFDKVVGQLPESIRAGGPERPAPPSRDECARWLAYTVVERYRCVLGILSMVDRPPFIQQSDHVRMRARLAAMQRECEKHLGPNDTAETLAIYRQALQRAGDDCTLRRNYALALLGRGQHDDAVEQLRLALQRMPYPSQYYFNLGIVLLAQGKRSEAEAAFDKSTQGIWWLPDRNEEIGNEFLHAGLYDKAIDYYRRALALDARRPRALCGVGNALIKLGKRDEAMTEFSRAADLAPDDPDVQCELASALAGTGQRQRAIEVLSKAVKLNPLSVKAGSFLAGLLFHAGKYEEAAGYLAQVAALDPDDPDVRFRYAETLSKLGRRDEADREYRESQRLQAK